MKHWLIGMACCLGMAWPAVSFGQTPKDEPAVVQNAAPLAPSGGPVVITGDTFEFDTTQKMATYTGNAKVIQGDTNVFADQLVIYLGQAEGGFEKAVATGNVRIIYKEITATGEQGTFYQADQKLDIEGKARAWQGNNTITAQRLIAFFKEGIVLEGYSASAAERVTMTVYSQQKALIPEAAPTPGKTPTPAKTPKPGKTPTPEKTATPEPAAGSVATPPDQNASPTVIVSDTLRLDNPKQQATFTGNVVVTKDVSQIHADEMLVYIRKTPDKGDEIEKIEVAGNVSIVKESITVTGDKGQYSELEQYAKVEGAPPKKARAEDKTKKITLEAPIIEVFLATNTIKGKGGPTRTIFDNASSVAPALTLTPPSTPLTVTATPTPEPKVKGKRADVNREEFPSVTVFPK